MPSFRIFLLTTTLLAAVPIVVQARPVAFDLPVQPLEAALNAVVNPNGLNLIVNQTLLAGKTAPALKGQFEPAEALRRLLAGSGLTVTISGNTAEITRQTGEIALEPVKVADTKAPAPGSAAAGYLVTDTTAAGPIWGDMKLQDTPYSMSVVSSELIDNTQAYKAEDLAKFIPQVTNLPQAQNRNGTATLSIRGFSVQSGTVSGTTVDGLLTDSLYNIPLEDKDKVEVLSGVNGFLYGMNGVGGNVNYVLKRPTETPYNSITIGDNAGANAYIHGDFGGPVGYKFGYRINIVKQDGDTSLENQQVNRELVSAAFDIRPADTLLIQFNAADSDYRVHGETPSFSTTQSLAETGRPLEDFYALLGRIRHASRRRRSKAYLDAKRYIHAKSGLRLYGRATIGHVGS